MKAGMKRAQRRLTPGVTTSGIINYNKPQLLGAPEPKRGPNFHPKRKKKGARK